MDKDQAFRDVQNNIAKGNREIVGPQVIQIASEFNDPNTLLTCASLLKVVNDIDNGEKIIDILFSNLPESESMRLEIAKGLRGLGLFDDSLRILKELHPNDAVYREFMTSYYGSGNYKESVKAHDLISESTINDDIMEIDAYCSLREFSVAQKKIEDLVSEEPNDFDVRKCYVSVLLRCGKLKDAEKYVKDILKSEKSSADANALAGYFMWMNGKISAAGGYATKAIKIDNKHVGAMEILAFCLIEKGKKEEARIVAGAINEQIPGHQAVVRIIDACRD